MIVGSSAGAAAMRLIFTCLCLLWCSAGTAASPADIAEGREIYELYCGACHGFDGRALMPGTPSFVKGDRLDKSIEELLESINDGKGAAMPSWRTVLNPTECKQVLDFIFTIHGK